MEEKKELLEKELKEEELDKVAGGVRFGEGEDDETDDDFNDIP